MTQMDFLFGWVVWAGLVGAGGVFIAWSFGLFDGEESKWCRMWDEHK